LDNRGKKLVSNLFLRNQEIALLGFSPFFLGYGACWKERIPTLQWTSEKLGIAFVSSGIDHPPDRVFEIQEGSYLKDSMQFKGIPVPICRMALVYSKAIDP